MTPHPDHGWLVALFNPTPAQAAAWRAAEDARIQALPLPVVPIAADKRQARCRKCGGSGTLPQYLHRNNGACDRCGGTGSA